MAIILDKNGDIALYLQLSEGIIGEIQDGRILADTMIPSERALMREYGVSRATVRQALDRLARLGYLRKEHGRGNFVALPGAASSPGSLGDFVEEMRSQGREARTEVVFFRIVQCYPELAPLMRLGAKDYTFKFIRLHWAEDEPQLLETTYLPYTSFEGLNKEDLLKVPLREIISVWYRKAITRTEESFRITRLDADQARLLHTSEGAAALEKTLVSYSRDQVIEYTVSLTPENRMKFHIVIEK